LLGFEDVGNDLPSVTASHTRRLESVGELLWEPQILYYLASLVYHIYWNARQVFTLKFGA
jgi:hypothetical protein